MHIRSVGLLVCVASLAAQHAGAETPIVPADLSKLNLTMRFVAGANLVPHDESIYALPVIGFDVSPVRVCFVWFGTASAGPSGHRVAANFSWDLDPTVGGIQPMHTGSLGGSATLTRTTGDTTLQTSRIDTTIPAGNDTALVYGAYQGFLWALIKTPSTISPGGGAVVAGDNHNPSIEIDQDGAAGYVAKFRLPSYINGYPSTDNDTTPVTTPITLNTWVLVMARYSGTRKEIRTNGGAWVAADTYNLSHTQDGQGIFIGGFMPYGTEIADVGAQSNTVDDATADAIYLAIRALYPAAALPDINAAPTARALRLDFDGDGASDLGVYYSKTGQSWMRQSTNGAVFSGGPVTWGPSGTPVPGDYDGDGIADFAVYTQADGKWNILQSKTGTVLGGAPIGWGWSATYPVPADYDGDGKCDLAVFDHATGNWYVRQSSDNLMLGGAPNNWGWDGTIPVPGDYDGDGKADLAVFNRAAGDWYVRQSHNNLIMSGGPINWGWSATIPVPADYDGDGKTDLAVYSPSDGKWYIRASGTGAALSGSPFTWGAAVAYPIPNDYDGDGKADIGVYAPGNGKWYIRQSHDGTMLGGGVDAKGGVFWGKPGQKDLTPASSAYQTLRLTGLVP